jgi:hypothetical protein
MLPLVTCSLMQPTPRLPRHCGPGTPVRRCSQRRACHDGVALVTCSPMPPTPRTPRPCSPSQLTEISPTPAHTNTARTHPPLAPPRPHENGARTAILRSLAATSPRSENQPRPPQPNEMEFSGSVRRKPVRAPDEPSPLQRRVRLGRSCLSYATRSAETLRHAAHATIVYPWSPDR